MGAHLKYKLVNPKQAKEVNEFVEELEEQKKLRENTEGYLPIHFWDQRDIAYQKEKKHGVPDFFDRGGGNIKTSSCPEYEEYKHLVAKIFEKLHKRFDIKVYSGSCSLTKYYFNPGQIKKITNDGKGLSGDDKERVREIIEGCDERD